MHIGNVNSYCLDLCIVSWKDGEKFEIEAKNKKLKIFDGDYRIEDSEEEKNIYLTLFQVMAQIIIISNLERLRVLES